MPFDAKKHVIRVQGNREYLPVAARLVWFRQEHPDWGIITSPIEINLEKQYAIFSASIMDADGKIIATGTKMENVKGFGDWLEKSETGAVGRALAMCGFGTQFAPEMEESNRFADAPTRPTGNQPSAPSLPQRNGARGEYSRAFSRPPLPADRAPDRADPRHTGNYEESAFGPVVSPTDTTAAGPANYRHPERKLT